MSADEFGAAITRLKDAGVVETRAAESGREIEPASLAVPACGDDGGAGSWKASSAGRTRVSSMDRTVRTHSPVPAARPRALSGGVRARRRRARGAGDVRGRRGCARGAGRWRRSAADRRWCSRAWPASCCCSPRRRSCGACCRFAARRPTRSSRGSSRSACRRSTIGSRRRSTSSGATRPSAPGSGRSSRTPPAVWMRSTSTTIVPRSRSCGGAAFKAGAAAVVAARPRRHGTRAGAAVARRRVAGAVSRAGSPGGRRPATRACCRGRRSRLRRVSPAIAHRSARASRSAKATSGAARRCWATSGGGSACRCRRSSPISSTAWSPARSRRRRTRSPWRTRPASPESTSTTRIRRALGLPPRTETDGGDVYAPAGTDVTLHVHTDRPVASGQLSLANGQSIALVGRLRPRSSTAAMKVVEDGSYRVALRDRRRPGRPGPDRILHSRARGSAARRPRREAGERSIGDAARRSGHRGAGRRRLRDRAGGAGVRRARAVRESRAARRAAARDERDRPPHAVSRGSRRAAGRLRLLLRARARRHARHPVERGAQRHLLPRGQAVRAGVLAGAEPVDGRRRLQRVDRRSRQRAEADRRRDVEARSARPERRGARSRRRTSAPSAAAKPI